jgi:AcrR family transcriptional regulator
LIEKATKPPRTKPPEERREDLMDAAETLFLRNGFSATTIDQIVEAANVAKGTFYLYFSSKDAVLAALGRRFAEHYARTLRQAVEARPTDDWRGRLDAYVDTGVRTLLANGPFAEVVFHTRPPPIDWSIQRAIAAPLAELLQAGNAAGAWSAPNPPRTAMFVFSGLHGVVDDALSRGDETAPGDLVAEVREFVGRIVGC